MMDLLSAAQEQFSVAYDTFLFEIVVPETVLQISTQDMACASQDVDFTHCIFDCLSCLVQDDSSLPAARRARAHLP
jgi:hypothetical protein